MSIHLVMTPEVDAFIKLLLAIEIRYLKKGGKEE